MSSSVSKITAPVALAEGNDDPVDSELASFSPPASVAGSDVSDTDAVKNSGGSETAYPIVVPFSGPLGVTYTENTPPKDFSDWPVYLSFCESGPTVSLECVDTIDRHGNPAEFNQIKVSKKLLCDHSRYFQAMFRHEFIETRTGRVQFVDILQEELMRLKLFLISGTANARINIGNPAEDMSNLVRTYELADRFDMPEIVRLVKLRASDFLVSHGGWKEAYRQDVTDAPSASTVTIANANFHREKLMDLCKAYRMLSRLSPMVRLICPEQLVVLIAECCPASLLRGMLRRIDQGLGFAILRVMLAKMDS